MYFADLELIEYLLVYGGDKFNRDIKPSPNLSKKESRLVENGQSREQNVVAIVAFDRRSLPQGLSASRTYSAAATIEKNLMAFQYLVWGD